MPKKVPNSQSQPSAGGRFCLSSTKPADPEGDDLAAVLVALLGAATTPIEAKIDDLVRRVAALEKQRSALARKS